MADGTRARITRLTGRLTRETAALRTPLANCVDGSADAVAVFAPAVGLIHRLGRTEHGLRREFENGASRVFASEDLLRGEAPGARDLRDDLFVGLPDDPANLGMTVYSPPLRDQSYLARKQDILRGCENLIGLRRGTLSEADAAERTATEITATGADAALTVADFQEMWRRAVCAAADAYAEYGEGRVGGFSIGSFSVTNYRDEGTTGSEVAREAALAELSFTGLVFAGVR